MARKFLDARPDYSDPLTGYQTLNAGESASWGKPENGHKAFDAAREWTGPVVGIPLGDLPVGTPGNDTLVKFLTFLGEPVVWRVIGKNLPGMPEDSITLYMDKIVALRCFDAAEPNNPDENRKQNGNNDWTVSNLRQWANSSASADSWYFAQHSTDAPPSANNIWKYSNVAINPYESEAGMLYEAMQHERDLVIATNRVYGRQSGNGVTCKDRFFPLTTNELGLDDCANNGMKVAYFADNNSRITQCTPQCIAHSNFRDNPATTEAWEYWTSTSYPSNSGNIYSVSESGILSTDTAFRSIIGVRLACNIPDTALVTSRTDPDGCHVVIV